jgi:5-methyltetrahydropteroyltriglutamate--homocysteine methyltransferase
MKAPVHSEVVGSLLRPQELLDARTQLEADEISHTEFKRVEDAAVDDALALQEEIGLDVVSDGELRRVSWAGHFVEALDGLVGEPQTASMQRWRNDEGDQVPLHTTRPVVVEEIRRSRSMCVEEWTYLRSRTGHPAKATIVSGGAALSFYRPDLSAQAYATREDYMADIVGVLRDEVRELVELGCDYIQLDGPHYGGLLDRDLRETFRKAGSDPDKLIDAGIEADNAIIADFPGVTFGLHVCRGNARSMFFAEGDYAPIARVFERCNVHRFLLEYDDERAGDFAPLQGVPDDRVVVLGLVTTKRPALEDADALRARIEQASRYVDLDRLALSPQCGFASVMAGNSISPDEQRAKLELVVSVAESVWG